MNDFVRGAREVIQDLVAPELKEIKGELKALRTELQAETGSLRTELQAETGSLRTELHTEIGALRTQLHTEVTSLRTELHTEIGALRSEMHANQQATQAGFQALHAALDNAVLRGELATSRDLADLRERVSRLEERLAHRQ
jgi:type I site-specific restriction endonuclease